MADIQKLAASIAALVRPDMKPKDLIAAVQKQHPKASKKDIVRAALYTVIETAEAHPERAQQLHDFAMTQRGKAEDSEPTASDTTIAS